MFLKVLSFVLNDKLLGVETKYVKEINRNVEYTQVPLAPEAVVGLFNMRGQIVTLLNLSSYLEENIKAVEEKSTCIILKSIGNSLNQIGFLIDKTQDVFDLDEEDCENVPANSTEKTNMYIKKVAKLEKGLLLIIDNEKLFS